ncbi:Coiled-coil-helix-coiled-coil-helix domain-containing protein 1 [Daphnia magna]|uniref:Coiled-coil-helix-coiled-coil-helix domain-containing protein 1 n=1 Tax=Daphnia magna TaxID=35525 RepID=A0A162PJV4_9CRUS|nr:Coiled-coil-helix-coiled-coil-helix domain-containing protein 1 [Daphnia magna]
MSAMTPRFTVGVNKANGRRPCREPVPFQEILPLKLKDSVSGKGDRTSEVACLQDMAVMLACFKKHDFNQALCSKEIGAFQTCYTNFMIDHTKRKNMESTMAGTKSKLPYRTLNKILKKYPSA